MVRDFRDLVAWQLAETLKCEVFAFTESGPVARDFRFRNDIRASSASAPANIAEGFGRFRPLQFAHFLGIAKASLAETQNHLIDARERRYIDGALFSRLLSRSSSFILAICILATESFLTLSALLLWAYFTTTLLFWLSGISYCRANFDSGVFLTRHVLV